MKRSTKLRSLKNNSIDTPICFELTRDRNELPM